MHCFCYFELATPDRYLLLCNSGVKVSNYLVKQHTKTNVVLVKKININVHTLPGFSHNSHNVIMLKIIKSLQQNLHNTV